jgi:hypothetical protein
MSADFQQTTQRYIQEDSTFQPNTSYSELFKNFNERVNTSFLTFKYCNLIVFNHDF